MTWAKSASPLNVLQKLFSRPERAILIQGRAQARRGFKNTVQLDSIIARSQHLRRQVMRCGIWACLMMWVIRVAPTGSKASPNVRYALINEPTRCANQRHSHRSKTARYSITSSARASTDAGTVRLSALAVLRLMTSSYFVGACTGMSAGFSPLRIRST
jgi:hypothetical protein